MDLTLLEFYLRIFALVTNIFPQLLLENVKDFLKSTVLKEFNPDLNLESLSLLNEYHRQYSTQTNQENIRDLWDTLNRVNEFTDRRQKLLLLLRLQMFEQFLLKYSSEIPGFSFNEVVKLSAKKLNLNPHLVQDCRNFIFQKYYLIQDLSKFLIVLDNQSVNFDFPILIRKGFPGQLMFFYIEEQNIILFTYKGLKTISHQNHQIYASSIYFFNRGTSISGTGFEPVYYNQILNRFKVKERIHLHMEVRNLSFRYENSGNGIHSLNLDIESEQLIGIIGRSGSGKSTLINILTGVKKPTSGHIKINNINLEHNKIEGLIGYVSQDDLLIEELSVFMNLYLNAKLCFSDLSNAELENKVYSLLEELDLIEVKDMQVGSALNRLLSGGQRKKLNIALELIRDPWILFADEPTSGLSSSDSEEIMQLLSEQTKKSRIVVANIHQPSSNVFKMLDKIIVLDREGYPVYFGGPMEAIAYFNNFNLKIPVNTEFCHICDTVNPETIFKIIEEKKTNEFGDYTKTRKTTPVQWHKYYLENYSLPAITQPESPMPRIRFNKPGALRQFKIFLQRNLLAKIANVQYLLLALTISPALALVLSLLCRDGYTAESPGEYIFAHNENIPSFYFMSVIVALFLGLIMSAEEIISDRKILMRESFLGLSKFSYLNSKVFYVFGIGALQSFLYVLISSFILEMNDVVFSFWIVMFSLSCFASLVGLGISAAFKSVVAIYIMVPLIIVPQMLLSGVVVKFNRLNKYVSSSEYVPLVGDLMASRWAYEALVVDQFTSNSFQKHYFEIEKEESNVRYNLLFVIPELKTAVNAYLASSDRTFQTARYNFIKHELQKIHHNANIANNATSVNALIPVLKNLNAGYSARLHKAGLKRDSITKSIITKMGGTHNFMKFRNENYNNRLADIILKRKDIEPYIMTNSEMIRLIDPVYFESESNTGRSHFMAAYKKLGAAPVSTFWYNFSVIWLMTVLAYFALIVLFSIRKSIHTLALHKRMRASE